MPVLVQNVNGHITELSLTQFQTIPAQANTTYHVWLKGTVETPSSLVLTRKGDNLDIDLDGQTVSKLEGFYTDNTSPATFIVNGKTVVSGNDTSPDNGTQAVDAESEGNEGYIVWQAGSGDNVGAFIGMGAVAGVTLSGVLVADRDKDEAASYDVTVNAAAGPVTSVLTVEMYDQQGNLIVSSEHDFASGSFIHTVKNGYSGPLYVRLLDSNAGSDYLDEASNSMMNLGDPLRGMLVANGSQDVDITITPITELAVRQAGIDDNNISITEEQVAVNSQVGALFGVTDITGQVITVVEVDYDPNNGLTPAEHYGNVLAMLSGADSNTGSINETLNQLNTAIIDQGDNGLALNQQGVELLDAGINKFEQGANSGIDLSNNVINPPLIPAANNGLNEAETTNGVLVLVANAIAGDQVTVHWGGSRTPLS